MIGTLALLVAALAAAAPAQRLEALDWMSGSWLSAREPMRASGPHWREEIWTSADGGPLMVGLGRGQRGFGRFTYEYLRLDEDEGVITLHVQAMESPPARYRLVGSSGNEAIFEADEASDRQRIVYRREGDTLAITASRLDGTAAYVREYRRRSGNPPAAD